MILILRLQNLKNLWFIINEQVVIIITKIKKIKIGLNYHIHIF